MKTKIDYEKIVRGVAADIGFDLYVDDLFSGCEGGKGLQTSFEFRTTKGHECVTE